MSDMGDHTWNCERPDCDYSIGKLWNRQIAEHLFEHERTDGESSALAKALAEARLWKARLFDHLYDELGPTRARYFMDKYEKGQRLG